MKLKALNLLRIFSPKQKSKMPLLNDIYFSSNFNNSKEKSSILEIVAKYQKEEDSNVFVDSENTFFLYEHYLKDNKNELNFFSED